MNTILKPADVLRKPGSCGQASPGRELALLDDDGKPVPVGEPGELYVRQFSGILDEYYKDARGDGGDAARANGTRWATSRTGTPTASTTSATASAT